MNNADVVMWGGIVIGLLSTLIGIIYRKIVADIGHAKNNATQNLNNAMARVDKDATEQWVHINGTTRALSDFKLHAEERFAKDSDVKILIGEVKRGLEKIDDKLDHLAGIRSKTGA